jgi:epoxyqueuosine reductase
MPLHPHAAYPQPLTAAAVKSTARELGFDACGVASADTFDELRYLDDWLARGFAGEMSYMARTADRRADVRRVLPSAQTVIVTATAYSCDRPYSTEVVDRERALVSRYAWGEDYHLIIGERLESLLSWMRSVHGEAFDARAYVDTGPVQERAWAQRAGIGWIGKNTCVIDPERGSWMFLATIITSLRLEPDLPAFDRCGTCMLCLEACPTQAFAAPWQLDATRCLSYSTIELKGAIPLEHRDAHGRHVYGCDICQEVCPWNHRPFVSDDGRWRPRPELDGVSLTDLWEQPDAGLRAILHGSAMSRAKVRGLRRNVAVAMGNAGLDPSDHPDRASAPSLDDPLVAEHVAWAHRKVRGA